MPPTNLYEAQKIARTIFNNHRETLYCRCKYTVNNEVDLTSCNMQPAGSHKRAHRIEWTHLMPVEFFGPQFSCWHHAICQDHGITYKGRKCCQMNDLRFRRAEMELYNLWPTVGLVNQALSQYSYGDVDSLETFYGCALQLDNQLGKIEPPNHAKGIIARANLFMSDRYNIQLSDSQKKRFKEWSEMYPPSDWEKAWAESVAATVGYRNHHIDGAIMEVPSVRPRGTYP